MGIQKNLFGAPVLEVDVIAHKLSKHRKKLYKKCGMSNCKEEILNKPHKHYCFECIMDNFVKTKDLRGYEKIICNR